jgi:poly(A) polymerase
LNLQGGRCCFPDCHVRGTAVSYAPRLPALTHKKTALTSPDAPVAAHTTAPRIIPRSEHTISRSQISPNALRVLYRLREGGFQAFLVGGCVRDLLLGIEPKDFDVATDALPEDVKKLFRNCRLIGRRFRLAHVFFGRETIEVATFRAAAAPGQGDEPLPDSESEDNESVGPETAAELEAELAAELDDDADGEEGDDLEDTVTLLPDADLAADLANEAREAEDAEEPSHDSTMVLPAPPPLSDYARAKSASVVSSRSEAAEAAAAAASGGNEPRSSAAGPAAEQGGEVSAEPSSDPHYLAKGTPSGGEPGAATAGVSAETPAARGNVSTETAPGAGGPYRDRFEPRQGGGNRAERGRRGDRRDRRDRFDEETDAERVLDTEGRILRDNVYGNIDEDVWRRDFTANSLYYNIADFSLWDYVGGAEDVAARRLRLIGDPETRYREDPVRMLRAARFEAKLNFTLDEATAEPIPRLRGLLTNVPPARLFDETLKLFLSGHGVRSLEVLRRRGLLEVLLPATAQYLDKHPGGLVEKVLISGLRNTDERALAGKPVTPTYLFALLLYGPIAREIESSPPQHWHELHTILEACDRAVREAQTHMSIPRRFSLGLREMFALQPRLEHPRGRRALRVLEHPRFRAAFDLLLLRAEHGLASPDMAKWWTRIQEVSSEERARMADEMNPSGGPPRSGGGGGAGGAGRRGPRRRRRRGRGGGSSSNAN